jgi:hypothetical protein
MGNNLNRPNAKKCEHSHVNTIWEFGRAWKQCLLCGKRTKLN